MRCQHKHCDDSGDRPGSKGPAPHAMWSIRGIEEGGKDFDSRTCLLPMITAGSRMMLKLHAHYRNRILPFDGGLLDQPNGYIDAMETIEMALNDD